ncbi:fructose-6-phosphate aldolase [Candidatus Woesearchaeota archaeon]|nr:MAG: hypothetical protein QS99_C0007G0017 [archaeon GW2011_AR4]MBS3129428.1 fructose-6-phosphate aldolase [Candidatus Woesearchaeota archaeon]HIH38469.1 fructose-6-phosphate aldolase [Candidatus Woesearchaeota archaeon]HIH49791.1 fructose-6-phosphate aldolase [Candidatus Woesearchaeota archaeon]HIJ03482.1 fructose-6-phosphate aldolase [Candidatus Woesearchaeota archaeon]
MEIWADTANTAEIEKINALGILDGVTTNPSLIAKEAGDPIAILKRITSVVKGPVSAEVISVEADGMIKEGTKLAGIAPNIVVKIPMGIEGLKAIKVLHQKGIRTNCTLTFSANQALLAAKAGASYVNAFVGRIDDEGDDGFRLVQDILVMLENYKLQSELIVASIRHPWHVHLSAQAGAHVATIPTAVIEKMASHIRTTEGINKFLADWNKAGKEYKI